MIHVTMGAVTRWHRRLQVVIRVDGGWQAQVATVQAEEWQVAAYARYFVSCGMQNDKAWKRALRTVQATYIQGYTKGLRECVARRAAEYAEMWPGLHRPLALKLRGRITIRLQGFMPVQIQQMYVPYQNTGRPGQEFVKAQLAEMGRKANG